MLFRSNGDDESDVDVINASTGGMCFVRTTMFMTGDQLKFKFIVSGNEMVVHGEVVRIIGREVGVRFTSGEADIHSLFVALNKEFPLLRISGKMPLTGYSDDSKDEKKIDAILELDDF
jgi:hypothetical protein